MDAGDYGVNVLFIARDIGGEFLLLCDEIDVDLLPIDCRRAVLAYFSLNQFYISVGCKIIVLLSR